MDRTTKEKCWEELREHAPHSIAWNHYDLARETNIPEINIWRVFLQEPDVLEWLTEERKLLQQTELAKLTFNVANSNSVGKAQLLTSMMKVNDANKTDTKEGPAYIYCYIPLNEGQKHAANVHELTEDIFHDQPTPKPLQYKTE